MLHSKLLYLLRIVYFTAIYACTDSYFSTPLKILPLKRQLDVKKQNKAKLNSRQGLIKRPKLNETASFLEQKKFKSKQIKKIYNTVYQPINFIKTLNDDVTLQIKSTRITPYQASPKLARKPDSAYSAVNFKQKKKSKAAKRNNTKFDKAYTNKVLNRLPNTIFFTKLRFTIDEDFRGQFSQDCIEKLDALHQLKIPYTFLSNTLKTFTTIHICNNFLNKVLVKYNNGTYALNDTLNNVLKNNITFWNLSNILHGAGKDAPEVFEKLIYKITEPKTLDKIAEIKKVGWKTSSIISIINGSGKQAPEILEKLINKVTQHNTLNKIQKAKKIGWKTSNITSMLHKSGKQAPEVLETLINKITQYSTLHKIEQAKKIGWKASNISSILNGSGKQAPKILEKLIDKITQKEMLHKITQLKQQGIQISDLSAHLRQSKKKPHNAFKYLITLLTSEKYIDTIQKVTNLIDRTVDVINPDDQILISNRASAALKRIGDLRNHPLVNDPSEDLAFKAFLKKCYHKNQHVDNRLVKVQKVSDQDLRISLHGQDSLVAKQKIDKGTILGIYTGILLCDNDRIDNAVEMAYLATKNIYGFNKLNSYSFEINLGTTKPLYLSGCGRGNILMKINANQTHDSTLSSPQVSSANVKPSLNSCDGLTPFILFHAIEDIEADKELLFDYGKFYWSNHDNNHDLSNPDAQIYRNLLSMKKFSRQSPRIRFLRLIKAHNEHLYKNLLKHIKAPLSHLSGKDRLVECRKIHECNDNNHAIDYRIYKLPGEDPSQGPSSKDYVSINWNPLLPLGVLNQYNWKESK